MGFAAVRRHRRKAPDLPRPYRTWGYPLTTWVVLPGSVGFLLSNAVAEPANTLLAAGLVAGSYPVCYLTRRGRGA